MIVSQIRYHTIRMERELMMIHNTHTFIADIKNWSRNRPPDMCRVESIRKDMKNREAKWVDGMILLWETPEEELVCYDGIHRLLAAKQLADSQEMEMVVQVAKTTQESYIMDDFLRINKSVPVSQLYSKAEEELDMKRTLEQVVGMYQKKYKVFFKPTAKPNIPHENRDRMMERLYEKTVEYPKYRRLSVNDWVEILSEVSNRVQGLVESGKKKYRLSKKQKDKCESQNMYLFAVKDWNRYM